MVPGDGPKDPGAHPLQVSGLKLPTSVEKVPLGQGVQAESSRK